MNSTASGSELQGSPRAFLKAKGWSALLPWSDPAVDPRHRPTPASLTWEGEGCLLLSAGSWEQEPAWKRGDIPFSLGSAGKWLHLDSGCSSPGVHECLIFHGFLLLALSTIVPFVIAVTGGCLNPWTFPCFPLLLCPQAVFWCQWLVQSPHPWYSSSSLSAGQMRDVIGVTRVSPVLS